MRNLSYLASLLYNTPLMIDPAKLQVIESVFTKAQLNAHDNIKAEENPLDIYAEIGGVKFQSNEERKPYLVTEGGVAILPAQGTLVQRTSGLHPVSGMIGYNAMSKKAIMAAKDPSVKAILHDVDSGGGYVAGVFEHANVLAKINKEKPIWSISNEAMYSAAYAISAPSSRIVAPETGGVGSIGVIGLHIDESKKDEMDGRKYTAIYAGEHKNDYSSHSALSSEAAKNMQRDINHSYELFTAFVAEHRPRTQKQIKETEARIFNAVDAIDHGLADEIMSFSEALQAMEDQYGSTSFTQTRLSADAKRRGVEMTDKTKESSAENQTAIEDQKAAIEQAKAEGIKEGQKLERDRITSIITCEESKGREKQAAAMACETSLTVDEAKKLLTTMQTDKVDVQAGFTNAMSKIDNPDLGASTEESDEENEDKLAAEIANIGGQ